MIKSTGFLISLIASVLHAKAISISKNRVYDDDTVYVTIPDWGQSSWMKMLAYPYKRNQLSRNARPRETRRDQIKRLPDSNHQQRQHHRYQEPATRKYFRIVVDLILDGVIASNLLLSTKMAISYK